MITRERTVKQKGGMSMHSFKDVYSPDKIEGAKAQREEASNKMTVTISSGKVLYADHIARFNILAGISAAEFLAQTTSEWRLADNTIQTVTLDELKEANAIALQQFGNLVGIA